MDYKYIESFTLLALGVFFILVRVYVRWTQVGPLNFQLDDYLMPLAGAVFAIEVSLAYLVGARYGGFTNSYITDGARAALDPNSGEYHNRIMGSKIQVAGWSLYAMVLWLVKFSLAVFYSRLTTGLSHLPTRVRFAYVLLGMTYLVVGLTIVLSCQPMHKFWQINPDPGNTCQPARSMVYVLVVMIPNVLTDFYLLSIPLPLLWTVRIGIRRKIILMTLFSGAIFVAVAAIVRAVIIMTAGANGAIEGSKWACRESFVSIVVANLPIIQPLIRRGASKLGLSALFSNSASSSYGPSRRRGVEYPLTSQEATGESTTDKKRNWLRGFGTSGFVSSVHNATTGSAEQILAQGKMDKASRQITVTHEMFVEREYAGHLGGNSVQSVAESKGNTWDIGAGKV
ncbi:hypothetical protein BJX76DRAFT_366524 [Aspergillus varians]